MDFPGGAITNIHATDGFSNIYWRIYTEDPPIPDANGEAPANGYTILKHLSRLKDLELRLRDLDCLVSCYPRRLGLWVFSATPDFEHLRTLCRKVGKDEQNRVIIGSSALKVSASGYASSAELVNSLSTESPSNASPAGSRTTNTSNLSMNTEETPAAIYAAFTSAVIGTISLQLARGHGAIPLGSRTLFTAIDKNGYASPAIDNNDPSALSSLTALQVQLTSVGKLTISSQTVAQAGITRLRNNWDHTSKLLDLEPGTDLWLSPHGTIARLVTASPGSPVSSLPNTPSTAEASRRIQWKLAVLEWLQRFGLWVTSAEEELWVEIDVWEPLHAKLAVQTWQPYKESQSAVPLKRILWPARYCFRRTNSTPLGYGPGAFPIISDPVEFAAEWYGLASSIREEADSKFLSVPQEEQITDQVSPSRSDIPEGVESLSRTAQYPDLQTASLVYPTPPDGPVTMGYNNFTPSQTFGEDSDIGLAPLQRDRNQQNDDQSRNPFDRDVAMDFGPSAGLTVGSGLYDTNGEDDLFGEINEKDFGVKGITDADFSFFDDPGFGEMENGTPAGNAQETPPQTTIESNVGKDQIGPGFKLPQDHRADELSAEQGSASQPGFTDSPAKWPPEATLPGSSTAPRTGDSQTISPPLSPVGVKKILFPLLDESHHLGKEDQRQAPYTPVTFDRNMNDWDQKYGSDGKFWFSSAQPTSAANPVDSASDIPKIGMPSRSGKVKALANAPTNPLSDYGTPSNDLKQRFCSESASGSDMSDDTDDTVSEDGTHSAVPTTLKRKRTRSNSEISTALRSGIIPKEVDREVPTADNSTFLGNFLSFFSDWSMIGYFTILQNQALPVLPGREEQAQIAQLLVDQVTQSSLGHNLDGGKGNPNLDDNAFSLRASLGRLSIIGQSENLDMKGFVSLHDNVPSNGFDAAMSRPAAQWQDPKKGLILKASPPHLRLRRGKDYLEALPSVVSFWETFGLEPIHGPKDISAYCIHPPNAAEPADAFLERFGLLYSNCNLGEHLRGGRSLAFERGLALWDTAGLSSYSSIIQSLQSLCEKLGAALSKDRSTQDNIVVYIINPFNHATALADICTAFWQLFQMYVTDIGGEQERQLDEVVLQVIPMGFLLSSESIVVPSQAEYLSLALEVYSRCPPRDPVSNLVYSAAPMVLAESPSKTINFKLTSEKQSPLLDEKSLHIAWSTSPDQRWITVAWSDSAGSLQQTISYCLRFRDSNASRDKAQVRTEVWSATEGIMDKVQARWRVIIVGTESLDEYEIDTWAQLAEHHNTSKPLPLELVVLNVNTSSDLYLELPSLPIPISVINSQPSPAPTGTPNAGGSVPSSEQAANSPTPASGGNLPANAPTPTEIPPEAESESVLTDICDESWIVVLSHRLNTSPHLTEYRPALASGYLLRRKGPTDGDGVYSMSVNLLYTQRPPSSYDSLLRDTLKMYRDLATLARAKGTHDVQRNTMPWHIAASVRAQEILSHVL